MALTEDQIRRYARHILLPDVGGRGQERLLGATVTVPVGPGGDAAVAALAYLAAAGVGRLRLSGDPGGPVTAREQAGGILYGVSDVGRPRLEAIAERIGAINPDVRVEAATEPGGLALDLEPATGDRADVAAALAVGGAAAARTLAAILAAGL